MTILKRTILDRCEVLSSGTIQVRHRIEEYDDTITPTPAVEGVYEEVEVSPAEPAIFEQITEGPQTGLFRELIPAKPAVFETITVSEPVEAITDIVGDIEFHRQVIMVNDVIVDGVIMQRAEVIPTEITAFMGLHKVIPGKRFNLYDRRHPKDSAK